MLSFLCLSYTGAGVGENCRLRLVGWISVGLELAGGLMPGGRGVGTSALWRSWSMPVGLKLAGRLMLGSRGVGTSALWRWSSWSVSVGSELAGRLMLYRRWVFSGGIWRQMSIQPELACWLMLYSREVCTTWVLSFPLIPATCAERMSIKTRHSMSTTSSPLTRWAHVGLYALQYPFK